MNTEQQENCIAHSDREMLLYLMQAFDNEISVCPKCYHEEETATMDSASFLREYLAAYPEASRATQQEPVAWQFQDDDGTWHNCMNDKHRKNTEAAGVPMRPLFTSPQAGEQEAAAYIFQDALEFNGAKTKSVNIFASNDDDCERVALFVGHPKNDYHDAYRSAMDRAYAAEKRVKELERINDNLVKALANECNGPTHMGEPVIPSPQAGEQEAVTVNADNLGQLFLEGQKHPGKTVYPSADSALKISNGIAESARCKVPPAGWECTRGAGHPGPCAAVPVEAQPQQPEAVPVSQNGER